MTAVLAEVEKIEKTADFSQGDHTNTHWLRGHEPAALAAIYQPQINLAIWSRPEAIESRAYIDYLLSGEHYFRTLKGRVEGDKPQAWLDTELPQYKATDSEHSRQAFIAELGLIVEMFCCLFELPAAGLRLSVLDHAMCPAYHVDKIPCRLICTFAGPGSEWLSQPIEQIQGINPAKIPSPQRLNAQEVAVMKGSGWLVESQELHIKEVHALVHRSPLLAAADKAGNKRLVLTLDFSH